MVVHISRNFKSYFGCADSKHKTELKKHTIQNLRTLLQRSRLIVNYSGVSLATLVLFKTIKCEVDKSIFILILRYPTWILVFKMLHFGFILKSKNENLKSPACLSTS